MLHHYFISYVTFKAEWVPWLLTGRLLRANHIIFNWDRLASWINLTEEWPYRTSWIILFLEETDGVSDQVTLKSIYERYMRPSLLTTRWFLSVDNSCCRCCS